MLRKVETDYVSPHPYTVIKFEVVDGDRWG